MAMHTISVPRKAIEDAYYFSLKSMFSKVPGTMRRYQTWSASRERLKKVLSQEAKEWNMTTSMIRSDCSEIALDACVARGFSVDLQWIEDEQDAEGSAPGASDPLHANFSNEHTPPTSQPTESVAPNQPTVTMVDVVVPVSNGRSIVLQNRESDGYFRRVGIFKAWTSEYYGKKAMAEQIKSLGGSQGDYVTCDYTNVAWLSPVLAREMAKAAGLSDSQVTEAFRPKKVNGSVHQPQLEGAAGELLSRARSSRPRPPGIRSSIEFVKSLDGMILRAHGRFIDATLLLKSANKKWARFWEVRANTHFFDALLNKRNAVVQDLVIFEISEGGTYSHPPQKSAIFWNVDVETIKGIWVDFGLGVKIASWANPAFDVEACDLVVRYMQDQISLDELDATQSLLSRFKEQDPSSPGDASASSKSEHTNTVTPFCGRACARDLDLSQLSPVPGLASESPPLDQMKRHGNYLFILGMVVWCDVTILVMKPGASFHGVDGMHARYVPARREFPNLCVMFMEPSTATGARDGEDAMGHCLSALGNAFQIGGSEKWVVTVAAGMQPADAARALSGRLFASLPMPRLDPASGPVPEEIARAFRAATASMGADGACGVKGRMWADGTGHRYDVEVVRAESELAKHKVDKQTELELDKYKYQARLDSLQKSLTDGLISQDQYLASL